MTTFAVIGASSMLGKELVRQLLNADKSVIKIGRASDNDIVFDLTSEFKSEACKGLKADVVLHCASTFEGDSTSGIKVNFRNNTFGCLNVLSLMDTLGSRHCCYAGTVFSYFDCDSNGMNSYGLSKAQGETILDWGLNKEEGKFCCLRLTGLYDSEGHCCKHQPWFGRIVAYASRGKTLKLPPSLGVRNYMHVSDAAALIILSAEKQLTGCWPACHHENYNHTEIASFAYKVFGAGGRAVVDEKKSPFRSINYPSGKALFDRLQYKPKITMFEGLNMIRSSGHSSQFGPMDVLE